MTYHRFKDEDGKPYGSFEVFHDDADIVNGHARNFDSEGNPVEAGWYWAAGFPGCLWDGEPTGPFKTKRAAIKDAQSN